MENTYGNAVITSAGKTLRNAAIYEGTGFQFTKFALGSGTYSAAEKTVAALEAMTELKSLKNDYGISSMEQVSADKVKLTFLVTNFDPLSGEGIVPVTYTANEIGLFAKQDGSNTEILYSICVCAEDVGDTISTYNGYNPLQVVETYNEKVGNAEVVTVDLSGGFALAADLEEHEDASVADNDGVHGMKVVEAGDDYKLQALIDGNWEDVTGGAASAEDLDEHEALTPESTGGAHGIEYVDEVLYINGTEVKTGSGGSTVVVTTEEPTLVGKTVTLTISGETYTGEFDNTGECIFEGITETGTATITASDGNETTTESLTIAYYSKYAVELWLGTVYTINISTTEATLYGKQITLTNGTDTATTTFSGSGTAVKKIKFTGNVTISSTDGNKTATKVITVASGTSEYSVALTFVQVYGASWDGTSTTSWTRTDAAANFTDPVPYVAGASSYGSPFDDLQPWAGMIKSTRNNNVVVAIPKFWYKITQNGAGMKVQIADGEQDGFSVAPAHTDRGDGNGERDVVYVGRYHCDSSYKSKSGVKPVANITRSTARTSIHNTGLNLHQMDFATRFTLWLLYIVEFADWNSQAKIGYGCGNNSATENMGYTDSMPYHTGTTQSSRTTYGLGTQYRGIEGLWDNVYDWIDGCYYNSSGLNIIMNPNSFSDSSGGTAVGVPSNGYPSAFSVKDVSGTYEMFIPTAASGSDSTYSCDYWGFSASYPCLCVGGDYGQDGDHGMFFVHYNAASYTNANIGCRLLELP